MESSALYLIVSDALALPSLSPDSVSPACLAKNTGNIQR